MLALATASAIAALLIHAEGGTEKIAVIPTQFDDSAKGQVPELFNDYVLTSVQQNVTYEVIGQDDIVALLGFEKQKDLLDCSDTSCMADIGGALGVQRIAVFKIARIGSDWVVTAKVINIKETKVESRVNEMVPGDVKALLNAVPGVVAKLFGKAAPTPMVTVTPTPPPEAARHVAPPPVETQATPPPVVVTPAPAAATKKTPVPDENKGVGSRITGRIFVIGGTVMTVGGGLLASIFAGDLDHDDVGPLVGIGSLAAITGLVFAGIGANIAANGKAQALLGHDDADGSPRLYWMGWLGFGLAVAIPLFAGVMAAGPEVEIPLPLTLSATWLAAGVSITGFMVGAFADPSSMEIESALQVAPTMRFARNRDGSYAPTFGMAVSF